MSVKGPKMRFRRRALPGYRDTKEPTAGELKNPVSVYSSVRTPASTGGFVQTLTCFHPCYSKFEPAPERYTGGENSDYTATHVFTIRWDGRMVVSVGNYVLYNKRFYRVSFTKNMGRLNDWLVIYANEHFTETSNEHLIIADSKAAHPVIEPGTHNAGFDLPSA